MTIQQIVRDILERVIEDGLVAFAPPELRFGAEPDEEFIGADPHQWSAEDLAGCTALLADYIRRKIGGTALEEAHGVDGLAGGLRP